MFELIRGHRAIANAVHCTFDLMEFDGEDLRRLPIEDRKQRLATLLRAARSAHCDPIIPKRFGDVPEDLSEL